MPRMSSFVALLTFALAGVEAQRQPYLLYSDAFIAENAFQPEPQSNDLGFDLRRTELTPTISEHMQPLHVIPVDHDSHIDEASLR